MCNNKKKEIKLIISDLTLAEALGYIKSRATADLINPQTLGLIDTARFNMTTWPMRSRALSNDSSFGFSEVGFREIITKCINSSSGSILILISGLIQGKCQIFEDENEFCYT